MNRRFIIAAAVAALAVASSAQSAPLTLDFCTITTECTNDGIAEARLTIDEIVDGDINNYFATLFLRGAASGAPAAIDQVQFTIGTANQADYEGLPSLITAPGGTVGDPNGDWVPHFGGIPNCGGPGAPNSACAVGTPATLGNNGTLTWVFTFDLADDFGAMVAGDSAMMRASYGQGQFSPGMGELNVGTTSSTPTTTTTAPTTTTSNPTTTSTPTTGSVPEPSILALTGLGLFGLSRRLRRS